MSENYIDVARRLREERIRLSLSQNDIAECVHITQGSYSKVELGFHRLKFDEIVRLCESGVDGYYLFTGIRGTEKYKNILVSHSFRELCYYNDILHLTASIRQGKFQQENSNQYVLKSKYVMLFGIDKRKMKNLFLIVRQDFSCSQQKFADLLGIDIKKARDLEKGRSMPDSELIWKLYKEFGISPAIILNDKNILINEISYFLENMELV